MFPSMKRCFHEDILWDSEVNGKSLLMNVDGVRFPYNLRKEVSLNAGTIHFAYTATNKSSHSFPYIWAANPLFNAVPGMIFRVPDGMNRIVNAEPVHPWGDTGKSLTSLSAQQLMEKNWIFRWFLRRPKRAIRNTISGNRQPPLWTG